MGFFSSIGNFLGGVGKTVAKTVTNPARLTTAIITGGASLASPNTFKPLTSTIQSTLYNPALVGPALSFATRGGFPSSLVPVGGVQPMAFDVGGFLGKVGGILSGSNIGGFQTAGQLATLGSSFIPQPVGLKLPGIGAPGAGSVAPRALGRVGAVVGRRFFDKYPNLAAAIQGLRDRGANVTRGRLWSLLKRFGPDVLITGGILTAAAVSELMMAGPGTRRMNPGNAKALRRSLRRLESFHKLCVRADKFRSHGRRSSRKCGAGSTQFVRQG